MLERRSAIAGRWGVAGAPDREEAAKGSPAPPVVMIDSDRPDARSPSVEAGVLDKFVHDFALTLGLPATRNAAGHLADEPEDRRCSLLHRMLADAGLIVPSVDEDLVWRRFTVFRAHMRALETHQPTIHSGPVGFIGTEESRPIADLWREYAGRSMAWRQVPGDHYSMWQSANRGAVAEAIEDLVAELSDG